MSLENVTEQGADLGKRSLESRALLEAIRAVAGGRAPFDVDVDIEIASSELGPGSEPELDDLPAETVRDPRPWFRSLDDGFRA